MFRFLALVGALCAAMSFPSFAADAPKHACQSLDDLQKMADTAGAKIVGSANYDGQITDQLIIIQTETAIIAIGMKGGCVVTDPLPLDTAVKKVGA